MVMPNVSSKPPQQEPQKTIQSFWAGLSGVAKTWIIAGAAAVAVLTIILIAVSGSSSPPAGYLNVTTLQNKIEQNNKSGDMTASTTCVPTSTPDQFICNTTLYMLGRINQGTTTSTITVTPDGSTWATSNVQGPN